MSSRHGCTVGHSAGVNKEGRCRECQRLRGGRYRNNHPERIQATRVKSRSKPETKMREQAYSRAYNVRNRARRAAYSRQWRAANLERARLRTWEYRGLPAPTRERPASCECCKKPPTAKMELALDHDHETGEFRGWLCVRCNTGIGALGDDIAGLLNGIEYLRKPRA